jgi:capsid protein
MLERLLLRSWLRDGEVFAQLVSGNATGLSPVAGISFWLEALEADYVPMQNDEAQGLFRAFIRITGAGQKISGV